MSKDAFFFRHDSNASSDMKLRSMRRKYGWQGMGWYWYIIECLRNEDEYYLEFTDFTFDSLSEDMKCKPEEVRTYLDDCINIYRLFKLNTEGQHFYSDRLNRDMDQWNEKKERASLAGKRASAIRWQTETPPDSSLTLKSMIASYEEKTGQMLTPGNLEQLKDMADNYSLDDFNEALDIAVDRKIKSPIPYIARVLFNKEEGIKPSKAEDTEGTEGMEIL